MILPTWYCRAYLQFYLAQVPMTNINMRVTNPWPIHRYLTQVPMTNMNMRANPSNTYPLHPSTPIHPMKNDKHKHESQPIKRIPIWPINPFHPNPSHEKLYHVNRWTKSYTWCNICKLYKFYDKKKVNIYLSWSKS